jgi:hypothetical protein
VSTIEISFFLPGFLGTGKLDGRARGWRNQGAFQASATN